MEKRRNKRTENDGKLSKENYFTVLQLLMRFFVQYILINLQYNALAMRLEMGRWTLQTLRTDVNPTRGKWRQTPVTITPVSEYISQLYS